MNGIFYMHMNASELDGHNLVWRLLLSAWTGSLQDFITFLLQKLFLSLKRLYLFLYLGGLSWSMLSKLLIFALQLLQSHHPTDLCNLVLKPEVAILPSNQTYYCSQTAEKSVFPHPLDLGYQYFHPLGLILLPNHVLQPFPKAAEGDMAFFEELWLSSISSCTAALFSHVQHWWSGCELFGFSTEDVHELHFAVHLHHHPMNLCKLRIFVERVDFIRAFELSKGSMWAELRNRSGLDFKIWCISSTMHYKRRGK